MHRQRRQSHKLTRPTHGDGLALPKGIPSVRIHRAVAFLIDWPRPIIRVKKCCRCGCGCPARPSALLHLPSPCATTTTRRPSLAQGGTGSGAEMMHAKSESDMTSLAASSPPRSPKRGGGGGVAGGAGNGGYYVQSPSRESHDGGYKSSSMQATPVYNSPNESPSHPSYGRHSRSSSVSRFSGNLRKGGGGDRKVLNDKGWPECNVIEEEGPYEDLAGDSGLSRRCQIILGFLTFVLLFTTFCLIIWGAARPYEPEVVVKSLVMDDFYAGEGTDHSGVPTKLVTTNCSLHIAVYNPATMFGIHVTSGPIHLIYSEISIAVGQVCLSSVLGYL
ncbi:hypothetical protein SORBI_3010G050900 [Sorghum bicolor]|uniref:Late embryogenesis abundant protein LEA-2 subgroup domain-containing protein n=2 Tax=Sorghum bicolor TaxID=4558 RepID=A0A1W0VRI2_SORBI|nr:hypothetical protein SORBI_3010G050900 [Sorghum bicolor]